MSGIPDCLWDDDGLISPLLKKLQDNALPPQSAATPVRTPLVEVTEGVHVYPHTDDGRGSTLPVLLMWLNGEFVKPVLNLRLMDGDHIWVYNHPHVDIDANEQEVTCSYINTETTQVGEKLPRFRAVTEAYKLTDSSYEPSYPVLATEYKRFLERSVEDFRYHTRVNWCNEVEQPLPRITDDEQFLAEQFRREHLDAADTRRRLFSVWTGTVKETWVDPIGDGETPGICQGCGSSALFREKAHYRVRKRLPVPRTLDSGSFFQCEQCRTGYPVPESVLEDFASASPTFFDDRDSLEKRIAKTTPTELPDTEEVSLSVETQQELY